MKFGKAKSEKKKNAKPFFCSKYTRADPKGMNHSKACEQCCEHKTEPYCTIFKGKALKAANALKDKVTSKAKKDECSVIAEIMTKNYGIDGAEGFCGACCKPEFPEKVGGKKGELEDSDKAKKQKKKEKKEKKEKKKAEEELVDAAQQRAVRLQSIITKPDEKALHFLTDPDHKVQFVIRSDHDYQTYQHTPDKRRLGADGVPAFTLDEALTLGGKEKFLKGKRERRGLGGEILAALLESGKERASAKDMQDWGFVSTIGPGKGSSTDSAASASSSDTEDENTKAEIPGQEKYHVKTFPYFVVKEGETMRTKDRKIPRLYRVWGRTAKNCNNPSSEKQKEYLPWYHYGLEAKKDEDKNNPLAKRKFLGTRSHPDPCFNHLEKIGLQIGHQATIWDVETMIKGLDKIVKGTTTYNSLEFRLTRIITLCITV